MQNYRNLLLTVVSMIVTGVAIHYNVKIVMVPAAIAMFYFFVRALLDQNKQDRAGNQQINDTNQQLHDALVAVQDLAISKLSGADQALRSQVVELLVEAGTHLGSPYTNSRLVYGADYFINWNTEGLKLVEQARQLIESYKPVFFDRGGGELH